MKFDFAGLAKQIRDACREECLQGHCLCTTSEEHEENLKKGSQERRADGHEADPGTD